MPDRPNSAAWPTTQAQAIELGIKRYYTGKPCLRGHYALRHASTGGCCECLKENRQGPLRKKRAKANAAYIRKRNRTGKLEYAKKMAKHWTQKVHQLLEEARS